MVEDGHYDVASGSLALCDLHQFVQAPLGRRIVLGENHDGHLSPFDGLQQCRRYVVPSLQLVVDVGPHPQPAQRRVKMAREAEARVFSSEAQEHVVGFWRGFGEQWRRIGN